MEKKYTYNARTKKLQEAKDGEQNAHPIKPYFSISIATSPDGVVMYPDGFELCEGEWVQKFRLAKC